MIWMNWKDSSSRVEVTGGSCRTNRLLYCRQLGTASIFWSQPSSCPLSVFWCVLPCTKKISTQNQGCGL